MPKFVRRRIEEIREKSEIEWRYVPTLENPVDLGTRGCTINQLKYENTWWEGPEYLKNDEINWPKMDKIKKDDNSDFYEPIFEYEFAPINSNFSVLWRNQYECKK